MATEKTPMEFIVWVETRLAGKTLAVEEVAKFALEMFADPQVAHTGR